MKLISNSDFDFKNLDYRQVYKERALRLISLRNKPWKFQKIQNFYKKNIANFINDWGCTFDPRNLDKGVKVDVPFILFDKQIEFVNIVVECFKNKEPLLVEKSRDMGVTWLCAAIFCSIALLNDRAVFGFGSRKQTYVDKLGDMGSILEKCRFFLENLPTEFRGGFIRKIHSKENLLLIPLRGSAIKAEAGDQIGRGDRTTGYCVDEAAHIEHPSLIEASLSQTTNFRMDVSTPFGMDNVFAQKRFSNRYKVFTFHWRDDPRKDEEWYKKQTLILDPVTLAQEIDLDYTGSVEGIIIPAAWVHAAVEAYTKLGIAITGKKVAGLDLADEGADLNAICVRQGSLITHVEDWSGKNSDIYNTVQKSVILLNQHQCNECYYDAEGLGVGLRGDAKQIQTDLKTNIVFRPFHAGGEVYKPELKIDGKIKNKDAFVNRKAHAWWQLRFRFQNTFRYVTENIACDIDSMILIPPDLKNLHKLKLELSQPTYTKNSAGKIIINKKPDGARSPNLADAIMMAFQNDYTVVKIHEKTLELFSRK